MKVSELRSMTREELEHELTELREEEFRLRIRRPTEELSNALRLRSIRRDISRINTILREDKLGIIKLPSRTKAKEEPKVEKKETSKTPETKVKKSTPEKSATKKTTAKSTTEKKTPAKKKTTKTSKSKTSKEKNK
ncbi:50S ribosomal protein L29 [candidate division WOR-3 bacterium]|nr:50S ribosomal protein L29 [candidate division WOR-3 bacterium]